MKRSWRQFTLYLTTAGMECSWLYIWIVLLSSRIAEGTLSPPLLLVIYGLAFGFNKLLGERKWPRKYYLALNALLWLVTLLAVVEIQLFAGLKLSDPDWLLALPRAFGGLPDTFGPELLVFLISIILWVLGFRLARVKTGFTVAVVEFQVGLALLLVAFFINSHMKVEMAGSVFISFTFVAFALLGMAIAHGEQGNSWLTSRNHASWAVLLFFVISLVIVLGLVIGSFVTPDLLELALTPVKLLWGLVVKVMTFIAHFDIWDRLFGEPVKELMGSGKPMPPETPEEGFGVFKFPPWLRNSLVLATGLIWIAVALLALWGMCSVIFNWLRRRVATEGVETESLDGAFKEDFFGFVRRILRWLFRIMRLPFLQRHMLKSGFPEVTTVREIYRELLSWAATRGWPRVPWETPYEYLYTLNEAMPLFQGEFNFITSQYVRARYGSSRPDENELSQLKENWHRIRHYEDKRSK